MFYIKCDQPEAWVSLPHVQYVADQNGAGQLGEREESNANFLNLV